MKLSEKTLCVVDTETTGLDFSRHEIIELACIVYDQTQDLILKEYEAKIAPNHIETADPKALKINGYDKNAGLYKKGLKSALIKFNSLAKDCIIVGQNIAFDLGFINKAMSDLGIKPAFDRRSLEVSSLCWFHIRGEMEKMSLAELCNHFGITNFNSHGALVDCRRTLELYNIINNLYRSG